MTDQTLQPAFKPERFFTKDVSFETTDPLTHIFSGVGNMKVKVDVQVDSHGLEGNAAIPVGVKPFEVELHITVTAMTEEGQTVFLAEVVQAGLFSLVHVPEKDERFLLHVRAPEYLFPFATQTINDLISKGGFTPLILQPYNFIGMYEQSLKEQESTPPSE
jgi:preprotein translocase subunit SecB